MDTLHDYIVGSIVLHEEEWKHMKEANRWWFGDDDAHIRNADWGREATDAEKEAIKHQLDIEIKGMQKALKDAGEEPVSIVDVKRYWKSHYEEALGISDLPKVLKWHQRVAGHKFPHLAEQYLIEEQANGVTHSWKQMFEWRTRFEDPTYRQDKFGELMRKEIKVLKTGRM